jgi:WD domain, G-beta repeat
MLTFNHILAKAPIQLYSAGLLFSPLQSIFRKCFISQASTDLEIISELPLEWNACTYTLEGHSSGVNSVVFSPDGSRVASVSYDNTVRVWDVQTGQCQHTLEGHSDGVRSVVFSPDGSRVASGSYDNTVRVWDVTSWTEILCYDADTYRQYIAFSHDSSNILVNGNLLSIPLQTRLSSTIARTPRPPLNPLGGKLGIQGDWITLSSQRILWLPPEYRPGEWASENATITIGSGTGRVTFVRYGATHSSLL